nr:hypothetical protein [Tanacetum cinerariifolium]
GHSGAAPAGETGERVDARGRSAQRDAGGKRSRHGRHQGLAGRAAFSAAVESLQRRFRRQQPAPAHLDQQPGDLDPERSGRRL